MTDYEYSQVIPASEDKCDPGLPPDWASESNVKYDGPAWGCNIALSTAPELLLNIGFIVHGGNVQDKSKFNLFSAEYNSYAAILHELSHAAFVMSDEAPTGEGRFDFVPTSRISIRSLARIPVLAVLASLSGTASITAAPGPRETTPT